MRSSFTLLLCALALTTECGAAGANSSDTRLTKDNFAEVGDAIVELLDTGALAMASIVIGRPSGVGARQTSYGKPDVETQGIPFEAPCPSGGTISGSIIDSDGDRTFSTGDRFATTYESCRFDDNGEVFTGLSEFTVLHHEQENSIELTEIHYRFDGFGTEALRWSGSARVTVRTDKRSGGDHIVIDYLDLAVLRQAQACLWRFRLDAWRSPLGDRTNSFDGSVTLGSMPLRLEQEEPFHSLSGTPQSGRLTATDATGARLQIDAGPRRYRYRYFSHGNAGETPTAIQGRPRP